MSPRIYATLAEAAHAAEAEPDHYEALATDGRYSLISAEEAADLPREEHDRLHYTPNPHEHYTPWTSLQDSHTAYTPAQEEAYHEAYSATYRATYADLAPHYPKSPATGYPHPTPGRLSHARADEHGHTAANLAGLQPEEEQPE